MATWTFGDGTVLHSGTFSITVGRVDGGSALAQELRRKLGDSSTLVQVLPHPMKASLLDASNVYMLDALAYEMARAHDVSVASDYVPDPHDAPRPIRDILLAVSRGDVSIGTVH
jgi:hypothetical protein